MRKKNDLFEDLNMEKKESDFCDPLCIDIPAIKQKVGARLDSASTERKFIMMKSKKKFRKTDTKLQQIFLSLIILAMMNTQESMIRN